MIRNIIERVLQKEETEASTEKEVLEKIRNQNNRKLTSIKAQISRRQFLQMMGFGVGGAVLASTGLQRAGKLFSLDQKTGNKPFSPTGAAHGGFSEADAVNLGDEGLSNGDNIDPYIEEHWTDGSNVFIPAGKYQTELEWWDTSVSDAHLMGDPAGVELQRPDGFWADKTIDFSGHVVVENITMTGQLGHGRHRLRVTGDSGDSHIEFRNFNDPIGSIGASDAIFMRAQGNGTVDYKWCYLANYPNSAFYQSSPDPRQRFIGCVVRNSVNFHRDGSDGYLVKDCLYITDKSSAPEFCQVESGDCTGDPRGEFQRPFKFDADDFSTSNMRFENLHYYVKDVETNGPFMDFQEPQPTEGTMNGIYVYNESDAQMFSFDGDHDWTVKNVCMRGPGNLETPDFFQESCSNAPSEPVKSSPVWTPKGEGMPLVSGSGSTDPVYGGGGSGGGSDGGSSGNSEITLELTGDDNANYIFKVDGDIISTDGGQILENNGVGTLNGGTHQYTYSGSLRDFRAEEGVEVVRDGNKLSKVQLATLCSQTTSSNKDNMA